MRIISGEKVTRTQPGEWWLAVIVHDQELDDFDITGTDVDGMSDDDLIASGSIICTPTANYIAYGDGVFTQAQASGGGGGGGGGVAGVSTWNGRSGNVYPKSGDYNAAKITTSTAGQSVQDVIDNLQNMITNDAAFSPTSERAVQNKVITQAILTLEGRVMPAGGQSGDILAKTSNADYAATWSNASNFMKKSDYDTDNNGRVDKADVAYALQGPTSYKATLKNTYSDTCVLTEQDKAARNGVVPLDENRKILPEFLPDSIMSGLTYGGIFNATTRVVRLTPAAKSILGVSADTMTLQNSSTVPEGYPANAELFYITTVEGNFANMDFSMGDWLISLGTEWQHLQNGSQVSSVQGKTGAVTLNSDEITEGTSNLYMTPAERGKLQNIEAEATKDVNVVQSAQITTLPDGTRVLRLTNKNGNVVDFEGSGGLDADEYLKKTGNASQTFVMYTPAGTRQTFTGNEALALFFSKVTAWLNALERVAFSGSYTDLTNTPTKTSEFTNDGNGNSAYPFITSQVNNLANYYNKNQTYTKNEVDALIDAIEGMNFIQVDTLPTTDIDDHAIYYVPKDGGGYTRYQHMNGQWLNLGTTDVSMEEYLTKDGNATNVTTTFTMADTREEPVSGEKLSVTIGKLMRWVHDLKTICFTGSWHDLEDSNELATQEDLEEKVDIQQDVAQAGKVLGIGDDGKVIPTAVTTGVVRRGGGAMSVIGNDTEEDPVNTAAGARASAFGDHTTANGAAQFVTGRYNSPDNNNTYSEIVGGGGSGEPENIRTTDWGGNAWYKGKVSVGNTTDNIVAPTAGNDLTPKNYVDRTIDEKIAGADLLKSMVVQEVPDVEDADDNILYFVPDPLEEETYLQYKKVLASQNPDVYVMARIGSTRMSSNSTQVTSLPTPSVAFDGIVYQYIGSSADYDYGLFYECKKVQYYCWLKSDDAKYYYTESATPAKWGKIYDEAYALTDVTVESVSGSNMTDSAGKTYTRLSSMDTNQYHWVEINNKLSDYVNDGTGTGAPNDKFITKQDLIDLVYPVGSIYMSLNSTSPANIFGGTWEKIEDRFLLAASSDHAAATTGGSNTVTIKRSDLPNVSITSSSAGKKTTNALDGTRQYQYTAGGKNNQWGIDYGTKEMWTKSTIGNNFETASNHTHSIALNGGVDQTALDVTNPYLAVNMWRRTA